MPRARVVDSLPTGEAVGSESHIIVLDQGIVQGTSIEWTLYEDEVMELRGSSDELKEMVRAWVGISSSTSSKKDDSTPGNSGPDPQEPAPTTESL